MVTATLPAADKLRGWIAYDSLPVFQQWLSTKDEDEPLGDPGWGHKCPMFHFFAEVFGAEVYMDLSYIHVRQPYRTVKTLSGTWMKVAQQAFIRVTDEEAQKWWIDGGRRITAGQVSDALYLARLVR